MSNLSNHAHYELTAAGYFSKDSDYGGMLAESVMKLIDVFDAEDHSGMSASMAISLFERLSRFEPLGPLTGADDEWAEVSDGIFQNRRCSHVFRQNGEAYDINGRIFREPNGVTFTSYDSRVPVTFPYTPKHEFVDVPAPSHD